MLTTLAKYLEDQGVGTRGQDIFVHLMPEGVTLGVLLLMPLTGAIVDHELPGYRKHRFQAIVRCRTQEIETGEALAWRVYNTLYVEGVRIGNLSVKHFYPIHEPVFYQRSEGNMVEWSINFDACYVKCE